MGSSPSAHLAYGFHLGHDERLEIRERDDDYGTDLTVDWWLTPDDEDGGEEFQFTTQIYRHLYEQIPDAPTVEYAFEREQPVHDHFGVELLYPGADGSTGYILAVVGTEKSVDWCEAMVLDLDAMARDPYVNGWNVKLLGALRALGITPIQERPRWLVFPSYG